MNKYVAFNKRQIGKFIYTNYFENNAGLVLEFSTLVLKFSVSNVFLFKG